MPRAWVPGPPDRVQVYGFTKESECPARAFAPLVSPGKTFGRPLLVGVREEYAGLGLRHGEPAIRVDGEPCDDDL